MLDAEVLAPEAAAPADAHDAGVADAQLTMTAQDAALLLTIAGALRTNLLAPSRPYGPEHLPGCRVPEPLRRT